MLNLFLAPFQFPFMVNAIAISIVVAIPCALLSVFLVLKGWALMGDAMSHAVFPGVVLAYIIGIPFAIGAFIAGLLCAVPGSAVNNQAHGAEHTGICKHEKHLTHRVIVSPDTALHTAHQPVRLRRTCKLINADGQHIAHHHQRRAGSPRQQHRKKHQRQQYTPCAVTQAQKAQRTCCALVGKAARQL